MHELECLCSSLEDSRIQKLVIYHLQRGTRVNTWVIDKKRNSNADGGVNNLSWFVWNLYNLVTKIPKNTWIFGIPRCCRAWGIREKSYPLVDLMLNKQEKGSTLKTTIGWTHYRTSQRNLSVEIASFLKENIMGKLRWEGKMTMYEKHFYRCC